ncbi:SDR family oxidoreductase [Nocardia bovistercoris]|uniref:SDR family oxidoreductase n=1 Tax=Nocardia bovistercoris TaxID=2785916 RepID=A0A931IBR6_9NOCA|nr:SDR family oxidoreductase [Nocardia bovistercoris]MBH0778464.1 SDR family oxidoreductase [Nocardia bovistercoris]
MSAEGKICLVTGATSGTGRVTARELAREGATVVVLARDEGKADATCREISAETGNTRVEPLIADLSVMAQVRRAAERFTTRFDKLDILVNNAGAVITPPQITSEGLEAMFAGNYLGHFLLTELLVDKLKAAGTARVINVSSVAHRTARIDFDSLHPNAPRKGGYGQSKLAQLLFTYELADRLEGAGITVNAMHPGAVSSGFGRQLQDGWRQFVVSAIYGAIGITPEKGADTILYLALAPEVANTTGRYFIKRKEVRSSERSRDVELRARLWRESEAILAEVDGRA